MDLHSFSGAFAIAYGTILVAEIAGDKSLLTVASLAAEFGVKRVVLGSGAALMLKMAAAVSLGVVLSRVPLTWLAAVSGIAFVLSGASILARSRRSSVEASAGSRHCGSRGGVIAFATVALSEWGDPAQVLAATLVASSGRVGAVWLGASTAMLSKTMLAALAGSRLGRWCPTRIIQPAAGAWCVALGVLSLSRAIR